MGIKDEIGHAKTLFDKGTDLLLLRLRLLTLDLADQAASTFKIAAALLLAAVLLFAAVLALMFGLNRLLGDTAAPATYAKAKELGATLGYGQFLTVTLNFLIIAFVLFLVVKGMNRLKKQEAAAPAPAAPPEPTKSEVLLEEIRDLLKK